MTTRGCRAPDASPRPSPLSLGWTPRSYKPLAAKDMTASRSRWSRDSRRQRRTPVRLRSGHTGVLRLLRASARSGPHLARRPPVPVRLAGAEQVVHGELVEPLEVETAQRSSLGV